MVLVRTVSLVVGCSASKDGRRSYAAREAAGREGSVACSAREGGDDTAREDGDTVKELDDDTATKKVAEPDDDTATEDVEPDTAADDTETEPHVSVAAGSAVSSSPPVAMEARTV